MDSSSKNVFALWFGRITLLGVATNLLIALAVFFFPAAVLEYALGPHEGYALAGEPLVAPRFAGLLLLLLSFFYIPPACDPLRHKAAAWLAVLARFGGAAFFLPLGSRYLAFGLYDLVFFVAEGLLLLLAARESRRLMEGTKP